ncbi:DUF3040 domain-containing protein [Actinomycetospora lemnae]|uniref:DUF3040 domain-containing protein n=1 Tax=Actinomycetospora lemnae TaxID=3019891 RepID=A0ABT5T071_9PSEU|nr:DUF3040 domain-containing protein [Actinomycetospora sp. DW7H6]MDD7968090.1 DUF3040 domain-containing protein [Actinomycetospora sp. DW7H6]
MAATPFAPDPQPREPRPLSERERRALSDLEAHATSEDPALSLRMGRTRPRLSDHLSPRAYNATIQVGVVFLVAIVVLPQPWAGGLVSLAVLAVPVLIVAVAIRRGAL